MSKKLTATVLLILSLVAISWLANVTAAAESEENKEVQIHRVQEAIKELESALEHNPNAEKAEAWKKSLEANRQKLKKLMEGTKESQKSKGEFPELEMAIKQTRGQLKELRQAAESLKKEGAGPDRLEATQNKIAQGEGKLEELTALLERRRAGRKEKLEDREAPIRSLRGQIQELKYALEHNPDSEKVEVWKKSLKESNKKLERLMAKLRETDKPRKKATEKSDVLQRQKDLVIGWVVSRTEDDITIETMETGKIMVIRIPRRRGRRVTDLARTAAKLRKNQLILAKYREGDELERHGVYYLQNVKSISFARREGSGQAQLIGKMESLESRLNRIEKSLRELLGREHTERERPRDMDREHAERERPRDMEREHTKEERPRDMD